MSIIKKIFFLSLLIFFVTLLFWGAYNLSFKRDKENGEDKANGLSDILKPQQEPQITAISDEAVLAPVLTTDGNYIKYYSASNGKVYKIDLFGEEKTTIADKELSGLNYVAWSGDKNKVISKIETSSKEIQFYYYDYNTQKGIPLKKNVDEIVWDHSGNKIFYKYYDEKTKERSLNIADPDGTNWKKLADLDYRYVSIASIPKSGLVSFWNSPDSFTETKLESVPVIGGEKRTIYNAKFGADYLWSPDGNSVLVSHVSEKGGHNMQLGVMNYNGGEYRNLNAPTFVSKCVWAKDNLTIYCSLPGSMPDSSVLPNEYINKKFYTVDTFWKISTKSGEMARIIEPEKINGQLDATNLFLNSDESLLFFVNRKDNKLYKINL